MQNAGHNLAVLTSGPVPPNPSELLNSEAFHHTLDQVRSSVDVVIIDTAPLLPVADGAQIASLADAECWRPRCLHMGRPRLVCMVRHVVDAGWHVISPG